MGLRELPRHLRVDAFEKSQQLNLFGRVGRMFAPYDMWEDYLAGMFETRIVDESVETCRNILRDEIVCIVAMRRVVVEWPISASVNLSNNSANRRAWLGQAACCVVGKSTASETKRAWWQLTDDHRTRANACADEVIAEWEATRN